MQIRQLLKPCVACGESLIFGHFAPDGDVLRLSGGWSRVRCPACQTLGPVRSGFRDACESWNALTLGDPPAPATTLEEKKWWAAPSGSTTRPGATRQG